MTVNNETEDGLQRWSNTVVDVLKHQKAICLLIAGKPVSAVCKELGVSQRTLQRWFNQPEFNQNLVKAIKYIYITSFGKVATNVDKAIDVLLEIIEDKAESPKYRLEAIKILLDYGYKGVYLESPEPQKESLVDKIKHQQTLLNLGRAVEASSEGFNPQIKERITLNNEREICSELYPEEEYPESPRQIFEEMFKAEKQED